MKKERCKICNKRLADGLCPECGWRESYSSASTQEQLIETKTTDKKTLSKKTFKIVWGSVCVLMMILPMLLHTAPFQFLIYSVQQQQVLTAIPAAVYENAPRLLAAEGGPVEVTLSEGNYIVGVDLPEGVYQASVVDRIASIELEDESNQIYFFSWLSEDNDSESPYMQDVRLYQGATLRIETGTVLFASSNAQLDTLLVLPQNESLETVYPDNGAVAGVDFPVGIYDIRVIGDGNGFVEISLPENSDSSWSFFEFMGTGMGELTSYCNIEFPKGALLEFSDIEIALVPSVRNSLVAEKEE